MAETTSVDSPPEPGPASAPSLPATDSAPLPQPAVALPAPYPYLHPGYPAYPAPPADGAPAHPWYPPHPAYYYPPPYYAHPGQMPPGLMAAAAPPVPGAPTFPIWPSPAWPGSAWANPALPGSGKSPAELAAVQHNQRLLVLGIIAVLAAVHLPWLGYLFAMHGCWGNFFDLCFVRPTGADGLDQPTFLFARIAFFILRVQTTLAVDFQQFTQVMQIGTGLGSYALTKIVAANGTVVQGRLQRYGLAATCAVAFVVLFWAELTLSSTANYPVLGDETVLGYIDSELPADFVGASEAKSGLMKYLQFLRLADALIFGAALAMPKSPRTLASQDLK